MKVWIVDDADGKIYGVYSYERLAMDKADEFEEEHGKEFYVESYKVEG